MCVLLFGESYFEICSPPCQAPFAFSEESKFPALIYSFIGVIELKMDAPHMVKAVCDNLSLTGRSIQQP